MVVGRPVGRVAWCRGVVGDGATAPGSAPSHGVGTGRALGRGGTRAARAARAELWAGDSSGHDAGARGLRVGARTVAGSVVASRMASAAWTKVAWVKACG